MYRRKRQSVNFISFGLIFAAIVMFVIFTSDSSGDKAKQLVDEFYSYEQQGNFGDSWDLLHPLMKEKWPKDTYITDRAHVFIGHFGADGFEYSIGDSEKISGWRMAGDVPVFKQAYKFDVTQNYKGKYGKFSFIQNVYVVKNKKGDYKILWDYN